MVLPSSLTLDMALFIFGAVVGSFLNVCIYRLPAGRSIVSPGSTCPHCDTPIRWFDNVPIASFLILRGRCRSCGGRISPRYPLVELLAGLVPVLVAHRFGLTPASAAYVVFIWALIAITFIDLDHQIIPDRISIPGTILGLILGATILPVGWTGSLLGAVLGGGLFYLIAVASRGGMGGGDIKLIAMIGAFLGWQAVFLTILISALAGSAVGIYMMAVRGKGRKHPIPYGPFLVLGAVVYLFYGSEIIGWYLGIRG